MFVWQNVGDPGQPRVRLRGAIDERACFDGLAGEAAELVLVADGVRYINSTGLKRFWAFLEPLAQRCTVVLERCSPAFVTQLNLTPALADSVRVRSLIAPLECTECVAEADILVEIPPEGGEPTVPSRTCEVCGAAMVLAELEERYFAFLR